MKKTTLCYIEKDEKYLMLHRNKKQNDPNEGKWIGVGGKIREYESPAECVKREVFEETGLIIKSPRFRGIVHFISEYYPNEDMYLYTADKFSGTLKECDEGDLQWINKDDVLSLNLWEGDKIFLEELKKDTHPFELTLSYGKDNLISYELRGIK